MSDQLFTADMNRLYSNEVDNKMSLIPFFCDIVVILRSTGKTLGPKPIGLCGHFVITIVINVFGHKPLRNI